MKENAILKAIKNKKGYYVLVLDFDGFYNIPIKINDFEGTKKKTAQKLTYAIAKKLGA